MMASDDPTRSRPRPTYRSGRAIGTLTVAILGLGASLGLTACGDDRDQWADRGTPVAQPAEPVPSPTYDSSVDGVGGIRTALEDRVRVTAGVTRPLKSDCSALHLRQSFTCTITFMGEDITYQVKTTPDGGNRFRWTATPDALVATRAGIEAALWQAYATRASEIRCDPGLPDQQRVPPGTTLKQRCYFRPVRDDRTFGAKSDNAGRTVAVSIKIDDGRIRLTEELQ